MRKKTEPQAEFFAVVSTGSFTVVHGRTERELSDNLKEVVRAVSDSGDRISVAGFKGTMAEAVEPSRVFGLVYEGRQITIPHQSEVELLGNKKDAECAVTSATPV